MKRRTKLATVLTSLLIVCAFFTIVNAFSPMTFTIPFTGTVPAVENPVVTIAIGNNTATRETKTVNYDTPSATFTSISWGTFTQGGNNYKSSLGIHMDASTGNLPVTLSFAMTGAPTGWQLVLVQNGVNVAVLSESAPTYPMSNTGSTSVFDGYLMLKLPITTPQGQLSGTLTITVS